MGLVSRKAQMFQGITDNALTFRKQVKRDLERLGITVSRKLVNTITAEVGRISDGYVITVSYMDYGKILQHLSYQSDLNPTGKIAQNRKIYRKIRANERRLERKVMNLVVETYADASEDMFLSIGR